ncbi:uncharacterized protein LOC120890331 [Ictidomys tridecemlineatus]
MGGSLARCLQRCLRTAWAALPSCRAQQPGSASPRSVRRPRDPGLFHPALIFPGFFVLSRALPRIVPKTEPNEGPRPADPPDAQPGAPKPPLWQLLKAGLSAPGPGRTKRGPPGAQRRRRIRSPVTVLIDPPQRPGTRYECPPVAPTADPCAKATVLQALSKCPKGRKKFDGPLWFEKPEPEVPKPQVAKPQVPKPEDPKLEVPEPPKTPEPRPSAFAPVISNGVARPFAPQPEPLTRIFRPVPRRPRQGLSPSHPLAGRARCVPWCRHCTGQGHCLAAGDPGASAPQSRGLGPGRRAQQTQQKIPPEPRRPPSPMVPLTAPRGPNGHLLFRYTPTVTIVSY